MDYFSLKIVFAGSFLTCTTQGYGLQELIRARIQKQLDRIFSKCIFLKALDLNQVPMGVRAMAQTKNLTTVGLRCEKAREDDHFLRSLVP